MREFQASILSNRTFSPSDREKFEFSVFVDHFLLFLTPDQDSELWRIPLALVFKLISRATRRADAVLQEERAPGAQHGRGQCREGAEDAARPAHKSRSSGPESGIIPPALFQSDSGKWRRPQIWDKWSTVRNNCQHSVRLRKKENALRTRRGQARHISDTWNRAQKNFQLSLQSDSGNLILLWIGFFPFLMNFAKPPFAQCSMFKLQTFLLMCSILLFVNQYVPRLL